MLGLGLKLVNFRYGGSEFTILLAGAGQSLIDRWFDVNDDGEQGVVAGALAQGATLTAIDGATGNTALTFTVGDHESTGYWWNNTNSTAGPALTTFYNAIDAVTESRTEVQAIIWHQGSNEANNISVAPLELGDITRETYKTALTELFADMFAQTGATIYISKWHRRATGGEDYATQQIRDIQEELISEVAYVKYACDTYDLALTDAVHLTDEAEGIHGARVGRVIAADLQSKPLTGLIGPVISGVSADKGVYTFSLTHSGGDDITGTEGLYLVDSNGVVSSTFSKVNGSTLRLTVADGSVPNIDDVTAYVNYGTGNGLTTANVIKDNSTNTLPIRSAKITPTSSNPIQADSNVVSYIDAKASPKTAGSGAEITAISSIKGVHGFSTDTDNSKDNFEYDATLFGGAGGIIGKTNDARLLSPVDTFAASGSCTLGFVVNFPDPVNNDVNFLGFAGSGGASLAASRIFTNSGSIRYNKSEDAFPIILSNAAAAGTSRIIILNFKSDTELDVWVDNSLVLDGIDAENANGFQLASRYFLGTRHNSSIFLPYTAFGSVFFKTTASTDTFINSVNTYWASQFGISI